jgi:transposase
VAYGRVGRPVPGASPRPATADRRVRFEIDTVSRQLHARLCRHHGYLEIQRIPGVAPLLAAVFVAEIGEVGRFGDAARMARSPL